MKKYFSTIVFFWSAFFFAQFPCSSGFNGNGVDDFITVPDTDAINLQDTRNRTVEFWFKTPNITTRQVIYKEGGGSKAIVIYLEGGRIYLGAYRSGAGSASNRRFFRSGIGDVQENSWHHVALTLEDTTSPDLTFKWFLDGVEKDSQDGFQVDSRSGSINFARNGTNLRFPSDLLNNWTTSSVGSSMSETYNGTFTGTDGSDYTYIGNINLLRIWNVARTQSEIDSNKSTLLTNESDLVAFSDADRVYYTPNGATEISLTAFVTVNTQFTTIPNTEAINEQSTSNRTIELRFRPTDLNTRQVLYEEGGNVNAFKIFLEAGRIYFSIYRSNANNASNRRFFRSGEGELSIGQWYHIAVTLNNATTAKWFLDGVEQDSQPGLLVNDHSGDINIGRSGGNMRYPASLLNTDWSTSSVGGSTGQTYNGAVTSDGSENNFSGDIDLFRIWNIARTPSEIDANKEILLTTGTELVAYQSGTQINYQPTGGSSPSASEDAQGVITWDGSDSNSWVLPTNWAVDIPPDITRGQKVIVTNNGVNPVIAVDTNVGILTVNSGVELVIQSGATLNIYYGLSNNGTITVENGASLIYHNCSNPISGTGTFNVVKNTRTYSGSNFYSYWSSPVADNTVSTVFPDAEEIYEYRADLTDANWSFVSPSSIMSPTKGYAIQNEGLGGQVRTFNGKPNNGIYDVTLYFNNNEEEGEPGNEWSPSGDNLIGNPYTAALDWDLVITDTDNSDIEGTMYLWNQQNAEIGDNNVSEYLLYNLTGGSTVTATGSIGSAQGFFVRVDNTFSVGNTANLKLKATHQVSGNNTSATFYKTGHKSTTDDRNKGRSWFKLKRDNLYSSILIGFVKNATDNFDRIYDGAFDINQKSLGFYSLINNTRKVTIQGLPLLLEDEKIIPLGFVVDKTGEHTIELTEEYINDDYYIYLEDKETGNFVDLNEQNYSFTINTIGENNSRFNIVYTKRNRAVLSTESQAFENQEVLIFVSSTKELIVEQKNENFKKIKKVSLFNVLGERVKDFIPTSRKNVDDIPIGFYFVDIEFSDNNVLTKKIVIVN